MRYADTAPSGTVCPRYAPRSLKHGPDHARKTLPKCVGRTADPLVLHRLREDLVDESRILRSDRGPVVPGVEAGGHPGEQRDVTPVHGHRQQPRADRCLDAFPEDAVCRSGLLIERATGGAARIAPLCPGVRSRHKVQARRVEIVPLP